MMLQALTLFGLLAQAIANFVINGNFEEPYINPTSFISCASAIPGWMGLFDALGPLNEVVLNPTQYVDLACGSSTNGFISQNVTLPTDGIYQLSFHAESYSWFPIAITEIYWDGQLISTVQSEIGKTLNFSFQFFGKKGVSELKFVEIGILDAGGLLIDEVVIEKSKDNNFAPGLITFFIVLSFFCNNQFKGFKYLVFFLQDLSMYQYDDRSYEKTMKIFISAASKIEEIQWSLFNAASHIPINSSIIPASSLVPFSNEKHMEIDGVDDNFMRGVFSFVLFAAIPTFVIVFIFHKVFLCLFNFKISVYLRRYFFWGCTLIQTLIEPNIAYFTYLFLRQSFLFFSFKFTDKIFLAGATLLFYPVLMFACCFFFFFNRKWKKKFCYFIYCFKRCFPSMNFLTIRLIMRGLIRGAIHACLHKNYKAEIIMLCIMETGVICLAVGLEKTKVIFMNKQMYISTLLYHFGFIMLNLALYFEKAFEYTVENKETFDTLLLFQQSMIYFLLGLVVYEFFLDFVPNECLNPIQKKEEQNNESIDRENKEEKKDSKGVIFEEACGEKIEQREEEEEEDSKKENMKKKGRRKVSKKQYKIKESEDQPKRNEKQREEKKKIETRSQKSKSKSKSQKKKQEKMTVEEYNVIRENRASKLWNSFMNQISKSNKKEKNQGESQEKKKRQQKKQCKE